MAETYTKPRGEQTKTKWTRKKKTTTTTAQTQGAITTRTKEINEIENDPLRRNANPPQFFPNLTRTTSKKK